MIEIEEIKKYISDDILDSIFKEREENIYYSKDESKKIQKIKNENTMSHTKFAEVIKNLPPNFKNCRENILDALDKYSDRENLIQAYDNEKFYKIGFCDGIKMILDINKSENK